MSIKNKFLLRIVYIFCLALSIIIYGSFMFYFCTTNPTKAANIIYAAENEILKNKGPVSQSVVSEKDGGRPDKSQLADKMDENYSENSDRYRCFLEFYIGQSVSFYQQIITILLAVIGILLVISFMYLRFTSKQQAEEMASEALNTKSFQVTLQNTVKKELAEMMKTNEYDQLVQQIPDLANRIDALEKIINTKPDDEVTEKT